MTLYFLDLLSKNYTIFGLKVNFRATIYSCPENVTKPLVVMVVTFRVSVRA